MCPAVTTLPITQDQPVLPPRRLDSQITAPAFSARDPTRTTFDLCGFARHLGQRLAWFLSHRPAIWESVIRGFCRSRRFTLCPMIDMPTKAIAIASHQ